MKQKPIPPELFNAFYSFLEYTDPKMLLRILRNQFMEYSQTLQDGVPDNYDMQIYHISILFEFLDAIEDHTSLKYEDD